MIPELYSLEQLTRLVADNPEQWRPMVFTCGCFDLIHAGHVRYLRVAKALGRSLVVGLNTDQSVQALKPQKLGELSRPIMPEQQRAEVLAALKPVDAVVFFTEITATKVIQTLKPDIYAKGGDYTVDTLPEAPVVQAYGGRLEFIAIELPTSTSGIIKKIATSVHPGLPL